MGFKVTDLAPTFISPLTPAAKDVRVKAFQISRTDTTASLKAMLPADASIIDFLIFGAASNAATTATVSVGTTTTANELISAQDVKTAGGLIRPTTTVSTSLPQTESLPLGADIPIYAKYAETGTASSSGGPYTVVVLYVR